MNDALYSIPVQTISKESSTLAPYRGQVLLVVNVASQCGFTPQYEGLENLHRKYASKGFSVLGFPCNQFKAQEPGDEAEIQNFCKLTYDVSFPLFAKIDVNGPNTHPLFALLKKEAKGLLGSESVKWNFTKFLIDREGNVIERFAPITKPETLAAKIEALLNPL